MNCNSPTMTVETTNRLSCNSEDTEIAEGTESISPTSVFDKKSGFSCLVCKCEMSSASVYDAHVNGSKHKKRVQAAELTKVLKSSGNETWDEDTHTYSCEVCNMTTNSPLQLKNHLEGARHKRKTQQTETNDAKDSQIMCNVCQMTFKDHIQLIHHLVSRKHKLTEKLIKHMRNTNGRSVNHRDGLMRRLGRSLSCSVTSPSNPPNSPPPTTIPNYKPTKKRRQLRPNICPPPHVPGYPVVFQQVPVTSLLSSYRQLYGNTPIPQPERLESEPRFGYHPSQSWHPTVQWDSYYSQQSRIIDKYS